MPYLVADRGRVERRVVRGDAPGFLFCSDGLLSIRLPDGVPDRLPSPDARRANRVPIASTRSVWCCLLFFSFGRLVFMKTFFCFK